MCRAVHGADAMAGYGLFKCNNIWKFTELLKIGTLSHNYKKRTCNYEKISFNYYMGTSPVNPY